MVAIAALASLTIANAGQIQLGGANGLTMSYVTNGGATPGNLGGWGVKGYDVALFSNTTVTNPVGNGAINLPTTDANPTGTAGVFNATTGNVMIDPNLGITYNLMDDTTNYSTNSGHGNNIFATINGAATLTVPVNVANADWIGIMINDYWGFTGDNPTITLNFAGAGAVAVTLTDGVTGSLRSAVDCTSATGNVSCPPAQAGNSKGAINAGGPITSPVTNVAASNSAIGIKTSTVWYANYATKTGGIVGPYYNGTGNNSSGIVDLDDVKLDLSQFNGGALLTDTLLSIQFTQNSVVNGTGNNVSRLALSAITVDSTSTPEPSTILLIAGGLGLIGFGRRRLARR